jgi:hypothetical protein
MDPASLCLQRPTTGIVFLRWISKQTQMRSIGTRADPGTDGIHDSADAFFCQPIQYRCFRCLKGSFSPQFHTGTIRNPIKYQEKHCPGSHGRKDRVQG